MREITDRKELQRIELEMLEKIHAFCEQHGLRYSLCGGTLLGAVRHKGFIPWDDDIDVFMPRPDYEKFCKTFAVEGLSLHCHRNDAEYYFPFAKIYNDRTVLKNASNMVMRAGVFVDVFPVDGYPDSKFRWKKTILLRKIIISLVYWKQYPLFSSSRPFHKQIALLLIRSLLWILPVSKKNFNFTVNEIMTKYASSYDFNRSEKRGCLVWGYGIGEVLPSSCFDDFIDIEFESRQYKAICGWDAYLKGLYGDYMQLPPMEKRKTTHVFTAWWKA